RQPTHMIAHGRVDRLGGEDHLDVEVAAQRLLQQMEGLSNQVALFGESATGDGPSNIFKQRIGRTSQHASTMCQNQNTADEKIVRKSALDWYPCALRLSCLRFRPE